MRKVLVAATVALFLVVLASSTAHARPDEWYTVRYHTVKPGETLSSIGRLYGVSPTAIASHTGIVNPNYIYPWQVLAIPNAYAGGGYYWGSGWYRYYPPTYPPYNPPYQPPYNPPYQPPYQPPYSPGYPYSCACRYYHTVTWGDNLYRISLRYGVTMSHIAQCNGLPNYNYVQVGTSLCIP